MARITVEDCLEKVNNRFSLIHMASKRVRQLRQGSEPTLVTKNRDIVTALREIAAGYVVKAEEIDRVDLMENQAEPLTEGSQNGRDEEEMNSQDSEEEVVSEGSS